MSDTFIYVMSPRLSFPKSRLLFYTVGVASSESFWQICGPTEETLSSLIL